MTLVEPHTSLLQELLLALLGYTGDVFQVKHSSATEKSPSRVAEPWSCDTHIAADIDWINPADRFSNSEICACSCGVGSLEPTAEQQD
jgi:hypothetical protein